MKKSLLMFVFFGCAALLISPGCASSSKSRTEEVTTVQTTQAGAPTEGNTGNYANAQSTTVTSSGESQTKTEETKKVTEKSTSGESRGVIGSTFHLIGQILAFPFKLVAGVIEFIF